jgi:Zn-dependent peptidase ImmA (M78 family)/transcriptional regulator with XRE-family HTH domain
LQNKQNNINATTEMATVVHVQPGLLTSARQDRNHLTIVAAAKMLRITPAELASFEKGAKQPSLSFLREMSQKYRISLNYFLLDEPVKARPIRHHRTLFGRPSTLSFETISAIRTIEQLQENFTLIVSANQISQSILALPTATTRDSVETLGERERERIGMSVDQQLAWKSPLDAFRGWRIKIENLGICVYLAKMNSDDCRGVSLLREGEPPAIVVNDNEFCYEARIFTLLHEYGHILFRQPGISDERPQNPVERVCNQLAAAILMPKSLLFRIFSVEKLKPRGWEEQEIAQASRRLKVSRWALAIRLETVGLAPEHYADAYTYEASEKKGYAQAKTKARIPIYDKRLRELGSQYSGSFLEANTSGRLDRGSTARMLNLRTTYISDMRIRLSEMQQTYGGGARATQ